MQWCLTPLHQLLLLLLLDGAAVGFELIGTEAPGSLVEDRHVRRLHAADLHLGVDPEFQPAKRAHPAIVVPSLAELEGRLHPAGYPTTAGGRIPGRERVFSNDCFGNRIEWIELEEEA